MSKTYEIRKFYARKHVVKCGSLPEAKRKLQAATQLNTQDCYIELWEVENDTDSGVVVGVYNGAGEELKEA